MVDLWRPMRGIGSMPMHHLICSRVTSTDLSHGDIDGQCHTLYIWSCWGSWDTETIAGEPQFPVIHYDYGYWGYMDLREQ